MSVSMPGVHRYDRGGASVQNEGATSELRLTTDFVSTLLSYAVTVMPLVSVELARSRRAAAEIPDVELRSLALRALAKRGNMQGAALLAILSPRESRAAATRAAVSFQAAYNYLDMLAEQPSYDPVGNGRTLHRALIAAVDPTVRFENYYALNACHETRGYLVGMLRRCREAMVSLPSYATVRERLIACAQRIVDFQSFNLGEGQGASELLEEWGRANTPAGCQLGWWEVAASAGSSLSVHALIALAGQWQAGDEQAAAVEQAYFPWIGALHSLLDSAADVEEDSREGQRNLLGYFSSLEQAKHDLDRLTREAVAQARALGTARRHEIILSAMIGYYLSMPGVRNGQSRWVLECVTSAAPPSGRLALRLLTPMRPVSHLLYKLGM
jgi:tetraprenyl-beta-curcumene synthase